MPRPLLSLAEPKMLQWCRTTAGMTTASVAAALNREEREIIEWEGGIGGPTLSQLRDMARLYRRSLAVFYLPEPPEDVSVIRDFRRLPASRSSNYSPKLRFLIRDSRTKQAWCSESLESAGNSPHAYVGSVAIDDDIGRVGRGLRELLGVTIDDQRSTRDKATAFTLWRDRCEAIGVFVFSARGIEIEEMRGFALPDKFAPTIVVNSKDSAAGKTFTLLHEMVHILLGIDGVSNRRITSNPTTYEQRIEVFCNAVAAEALVPSDSFSGFVANHEGGSDSVVTAASAAYRVSEEVIARRLYDLGFASKQFYEAKRRELSNRPLPNKNQSHRRGSQPPEKRVVSVLGRSFARMAVTAFWEGDVSGPEASELLNVKLHHLPKIERELFPHRLAFLPRSTQ